MFISDYRQPTDGTGSRRRSRPLVATLIATCLAGAVLAFQAPVAGASVTLTTPTPNIGIIPFSGDVFTLDPEGNLIAVSLTETPPSAPLYNLAGDPMNLTWGQFSSATAKSYVWTDTVNGNTHTDFLIGMSGLVPKGVYSLFYRTFGPESNNPLCPDIEPSLALTAALPQLQKPDSSSFVASSSGKAQFLGRVAGNLLAAEHLQESVIYHFNGKTYGPLANEAEAYSVANGISPCHSSYGIDAMRQFLIIQK